MGSPTQGIRRRRGGCHWGRRSLSDCSGIRKASRVQSWNQNQSQKMPEAVRRVHNLVLRNRHHSGERRPAALLQSEGFIGIGATKTSAKIRTIRRGCLPYPLCRHSGRFRQLFNENARLSKRIALPNGRYPADGRFKGAIVANA